MPGTKGPAKPAKVPWAVSSNRADGTATLTYTDPLTRKPVTYKFNNAAEANAWAKANVLILPPGATITSQTTPFSKDPFSPNPGGGISSYVVRLADGTTESFHSATDIGNWLVSKVGYATSDTYDAYQVAQQAKGAGTVRDTQKGRGNPPVKVKPGSQSQGVSLEPTPVASGLPSYEPGAGTDVPPGLHLGAPGSGAGGPGAPNAPSSPLPADASMADVETYIRANYGYEAWMLDIPELRDLLFRSLTTGPWDDAKYQGELDKTTWWQQNGDSVFAWNNLEGSDPAKAARQINAKAGQVGDMAKSAGLPSSTFDSARIRQVARDALRYTWSDDQIRTVIANEFHYQAPGPDGTPAVGGEIIATANGVKALAHDYMLPMTEAQAVNFAKSIYIGELTQDGLKATFAAQAAARFPALADSIGNGVTPGQFFSTYQAQIGTLLEKPADAIDFVSDPRWQKVIDFIDPKGVRRPMTLSETDNYVRSLPEWDTTKNAREQAYAFRTLIGQKFGKVAS